MTTQQLDIVITYEDYKDWPLTCFFCEGEDLVYSSQQKNARCTNCGKWQLLEEGE